MPYKKINFLGINFKIAEKGNWIKFLDEEIRETLKIFKITKDELMKSHEIDQIKKSEKVVKEIKIPALNRIEILGYSAEINGLITSMKKIKDVKKLREAFKEKSNSVKELKDLLAENDDYERSQITGESKTIKQEIESNDEPVFNFKRLLKYILENKTTEKAEFKNWIIKKEKK